VGGKFGEKSLTWTFAEPKRNLREKVILPSYLVKKKVRNGLEVSVTGAKKNGVCMFPTSTIRERQPKKKEGGRNLN